MGLVSKRQRAAASKTLRVFRGGYDQAPACGVRQPSAAFRLGFAIYLKPLNLIFLGWHAVKRYPSEAVIG